jgi:modification target Cys-rich repeat protein
MKKKSALGLLTLVTPALLGGVLTMSCQQAADDLADASAAACGPCGFVAEGDVGISGNVKLDGFFQAVSTLNAATVSIQGDFKADIDALIEVFEVDVNANASIGAKVDALVLAIEADVTANASGGLSVNYAPPRCEANVSVAVSAQAKCEAKAKCEATIDPGSVEVECSGTCEGSCSAECTGGFECDFKAGAACEGECKGSCELDAAAACEGTCRGTCSGSCTAYDGNQQCAGACDGECTGTCELTAAASCEGTCTGSCKVTAEADCQGEPVKCSGSCSGTCSGSCQGSARPPSVMGECEASAECQAQAEAQASASVECKPPSLEVSFEFSGDASAQAAFLARMSELKLRGVAILRGFAKYQALINGRLDAQGEVVFNPPPVVVVTTALEGVIEAGVDGELFADIPPGRIGCVIPALTESVGMLEGMSTGASATLAAQGDFAAAMKAGFSG